MQTARFLLVLLTGPSLARFIAGKATAAAKIRELRSRLNRSDTDG